MTRSMPTGRSAASYLIAAAVAAVLCLFALPASAGPLGANVCGGYYSEVEEVMAGAGLTASLASITLNPNAEYVFVSGGKLYTLNADVHWSVLPLPAASLWIGGGLSQWIMDPDGGDSDTKTGVNLMAGAGLSAVRFKPYAQLKYVMVEDLTDPIAITAGIRF